VIAVPWRRGLVTAAVLATLAVQPAAAAGGPALSVAEDRLAAGLACPGRFGGEHEPVLLVHGTATNTRETWSWNYLRALPPLGFSVCTVDLPDRALGDIQVSAEYVVHAIRTVAGASGQRVDVIGHSQGSLEARWALRWWPDIRSLVDDYVSLGGPHHGASGADQVCATGSCAPAAQQMRTGARFLAALNHGDETPDGADYTSVFSANDELVQPPVSAKLDGAVNVLVQDLCPARYVHHAGLVHDPAVFNLLLDALARPGPADVSRFDAATCHGTWMPGVTEPVTGNLMLYGPALMAVTVHDTVTEEPSLAPYAR
jgi:triacylglycerol lipase